MMREVGDRAGEATTLNNMAGVYQGLGQLQRALTLYEQALPIRREVGDRAGEAATLNGMAYVYIAMQRFSEARTTFERSIEIEKEVGHTPGQIAGCIGLAQLLYQYLNLARDAVAQLDQALALFGQTSLPQDAAGHTPTYVQQLRETMVAGKSLGQTNGGEQAPVSVEVMQAVREFVNAPSWQASQQVVEQQQQILFAPEVETLFEQNIDQARTAGNQQVLEMLEMHLVLLRACKTAGIAAAFARLIDAGETMPPSFDTELVARSVAALLAGPAEKLAHAQYLANLISSSDDTQLKALATTIQTALFGGDLSQLGGDLDGQYAQAWRSIVASVAADGLPPELIEALVSNTVAVLGVAASQRPQWRASLLQQQAQAGNNKPGLAALTGEFVALLDAGGVTTGLGTGLRGIYAHIWNTTISQIKQ